MSQWSIKSCPKVTLDVRLITLISQRSLRAGMAISIPVPTPAPAPAHWILSRPQALVAAPQTLVNRMTSCLMAWSIDAEHENAPGTDLNGIATDVTNLDLKTQKPWSVRFPLWNMMAPQTRGGRSFDPGRVHSPEQSMNSCFWEPAQQRQDARRDLITWSICAISQGHWIMTNFYKYLRYLRVWNLSRNSVCVLHAHHS